MHPWLGPLHRDGERHFDRLLVEPLDVFLDESELQAELAGPGGRRQPETKRPFTTRRDHRYRMAWFVEPGGARSVAVAPPRGEVERRDTLARHWLVVSVGDRHLDKHETAAGHGP